MSRFIVYAVCFTRYNWIKFQSNIMHDICLLVSEATKIMICALKVIWSLVIIPICFLVKYLVQFSNILIYSIRCWPFNILVPNVEEKTKKLTRSLCDALAFLFSKKQKKFIRTIMNWLFLKLLCAVRIIYVIIFTVFWVFHCIGSFLAATSGGISQCYQKKLLDLDTIVYKTLGIPIPTLKENVKKKQQKVSTWVRTIHILQLLLGQDFTLWQILLWIELNVFNWDGACTQYMHWQCFQLTSFLYRCLLYTDSFVHPAVAKNPNTGSPDEAAEKIKTSNPKEVHKNLPKPICGSTSHCCRNQYIQQPTQPETCNCLCEGGGRKNSTKRSNIQYHRTWFARSWSVSGKLVGTILNKLKQICAGMEEYERFCDIDGMLNNLNMKIGTSYVNDVILTFQTLVNNRMPTVWCLVEDEVDAETINELKTREVRHFLITSNVNAHWIFFHLNTQTNDVFCYDSAFCNEWTTSNKEQWKTISKTFNAKVIFHIEYRHFLDHFLYFCLYRF